MKGAHRKGYFLEIYFGNTDFENIFLFSCRSCHTHVKLLSLKFNSTIQIIFEVLILQQTQKKNKINKNRKMIFRNKIKANISQNLPCLWAP